MQIVQYKNTNWLKAYSLAWKFLDLVYPPECVHCGKIGFRCCPVCWEQRSLYDQKICQICGKPLGQNSVCADCLPLSSPLEKVRSAGEYDGVLRDFILSLKYQRNIGLAELILPDLMHVLTNTCFQFELLIPVPLNKFRQRERGYNQVTTWGKLLSNGLDIPILSTGLKRERNTASQVTLSVEERLENVCDAFSANSEMIAGKNILLLDDVITTGATLTECARTLKQAGAKHISALTIARSSIKKGNDKGGMYVEKS